MSKIITDTEMTIEMIAVAAPVVALRLAFSWGVFPGTCVPGYYLSSLCD